MSSILKQSTAVTVKFGPFLDKTDGVTEETGLTIAQADIRLSKNGGDIAQSNNAAGATHDELGYYNVPLNVTDTNTLGILKVMIHDSANHLPAWKEYQVVAANVYDSLFGAATVKLEVDVVELVGNATITEPSPGAPPAAPTPFEWFQGLWAQFRNKNISDSNTGLVKIHNDAGTELMRATITDVANVTTKGKYTAP